MFKFKPVQIMKFCQSQGKSMTKKKEMLVIAFPGNSESSWFQL